MFDRGQFIPSLAMMMFLMGLDRVGIGVRNSVGGWFSMKQVIFGFQVFP